MSSSLALSAHHHFAKFFRAFLAIWAALLARCFCSDLPELRWALACCRRWLYLAASLTAFASERC
jgi:hypothetical protein